MEPNSPIDAHRTSNFYRDHYHHVLIFLMLLIILLISAVGIVFYQLLHRPVPTFTAIQPDGDKMELTPYEEPNLLPDTLLRWSSKAATVAYTFDFYNYN